MTLVPMGYLQLTWKPAGFAVLTCLVTLVLPAHARAQDVSTVAVPGYNDRYSTLVRQLEAGQTDIDYREPRESFLQSEQFKVARQRQPDLDTLRRSLHELMRRAKYDEVLSTAKEMLGIDYTDMEANKVLQQTYKILGDTRNNAKYHDIEFGLINSISRNGDGKTCRSAWPVVQVSEEYFFLGVMGAELLRQFVDRDGGLCDKMEVKTGEGPRTYYFEVTKVFQGYKTLGLN